MGDFGDSNVIGRGKYVELREYAKNHMKWKFRPLANLELKFCRKLLHKNEKSISQSCTWMFYVENLYTLVQGHRKTSHFFKLWGPTPYPSHNSVSWNHRIYMILWKCMTRFPILHIFVYILLSFVFQFTSESPKWPIFN